MRKQTSTTETELSEKFVEGICNLITDIINYIEELKEDVYVKFRTDHDTIGRVLKCHLMIEHYLNNYIALNNTTGFEIDELNLNFDRKIRMVKSKISNLSIYEGIIELNKVRNKMAHNLGYTLTLNDVKEMHLFHELYRGQEASIPLNVIEDFSIIACALLANMRSANYQSFSEVIGKWIKQAKNNPAKKAEWMKNAKEAILQNNEDSKLTFRFNNII